MTKPPGLVKGSIREAVDGLEVVELLDHGLQTRNQRVTSRAGSAEDGGIKQARVEDKTAVNTVGGGMQHVEQGAKGARWGRSMCV